MYNLKLTAYAAGTGFILSILAGLIGGVSFGVLILRACITGLLFAGLAIGGYALYKKYLLEDRSNFSFDTENDSVQEGQHVNIVLDDEPLPDEASAPEFNINDSDTVKPLVKDNDVEDAQVISKEEVTEDKDFKAASLNAVAKSSDTTEESKSTESMDQSVQPTVPVSHTDSPESVSGVGDLPDIDSLLTDIDTDSKDSDSSNIIEDSDFATTGKAQKQFDSNNEDVSANAAEMAKAIRSVLANDN
ncbi:MAG: hypothetical protein BKP49_01310 [Treponema sp. CETP13]|nr:MAG: hypothetical protein BKP49_01310 [Treponema sp. CETP13]